VLDADLLDRKLNLLIASLQQDFGLDEKQLHIAVAGLNPHSGEAGQLGLEEVEWLSPWLQQQQAAHPLRWLEGPVPPDTMWVRPGQAWFGEAGALKGLGVADAYIAMYHDQGLIPVKVRTLCV
jgi:4-hydroxythreonine-4-phosphate dehydrogenase